MPNDEKYTLKEGLYRQVLKIIYKYKLCQEITEEEDELIFGLFTIFSHILLLISEEEVEEVMKKLQRRNIVDAETFKNTKMIISNSIKKVEDEKN